MKDLTKLMAQFELGSPSEFEKVTVYPVLWKEDRKPLALLDLEEGAKEKLVEITEVSDSGSVPHLQVTNKSQLDLIIYDGEELLGAKQNRIVNLTVIVAAFSTLIIPVSCVEQGRWSWRSRHFKSSNSFVYPSLRREKFKQVSENLRSTASHHANQSHVWLDLQQKSKRMGVNSATGAMKDLFDSHDVSEKELRGTFKPAANQIGYIAFVRGGFAGGDLFASPELCSRKLYKLLRSYRLDSLDSAVKFPKVDTEAILDCLSNSTLKQVPSLGKGSDYRFEDRLIQGSASVLEGELAHLAVFPNSENGKRSQRSGFY